MGIEQEEERGGFKDKGVYKLKIGHVGVDSEFVGDNDMRNCHIDVDSWFVSFNILGSNVGKIVKGQGSLLPLNSPDWRGFRVYIFQ